MSDIDPAGTFIYTRQSYNEVPANITHVLVDSSVKEMQERAFEECRELLTVDIPHGINVLGRMAFYCCTRLTGIDFSSSCIVELPEDSFQGCTNLTTLILPDTVTSIGDRAFFACESLTDFTIPTSVTRIGKGAFVGCRSLRSIECLGNLHTLGDRAFCNCEALESLQLQSTKVRTIGRGTFAQCHNLISVKLPDSIEFIGDGAFWSCQSLTHLRIPASVSMIGNAAFFLCRSLISVEIPEGLKVMESLAFNQCGSLKNIALPSSLDEIRNNCFEDCEKLLGVDEIPDHDSLLRTLRERFDKRPVHRLCYFQTFFPMESVLEQLHQAMELDGATVDCFGMTPFHILSLSSRPSIDIVKALIHLFPADIFINRKDKWGFCPIEYLCTNSAPESIVLINYVIEVTVLKRVEFLGIETWKRNVRRAIEEFHDGDSLFRNAQLIQLYSMLAKYERLEITSLLELSIWKAKLQEIEMNALEDNRDRRSCMVHSGADIIISNVLLFLRPDWNQAYFLPRRP